MSRKLGVLEITEEDPDSGGEEITSKAEIKTHEDNVVVFKDERRKTAKNVVRQKKRLTKKERSNRTRQKLDKILLSLVKPDVTTNKDRERQLRCVATKGVVQLFNAVAARQELVSDELNKKMSMKERREALDRVRGSTFPLSQTQKASKEETSGNESDVKQEDCEE